MAKQHGALAASMLVLGLLGAADWASPAAAAEVLAVPSPAAISSVELQRMATGIGAIGAIANAGGASLYLALLDGRILVWDGSRVLQRPFLDLSSKISTGGERGLLGLAFHPRFAENGFLFVNYTNRDG